MEDKDKESSQPGPVICPTTVTPGRWQLIKAVFSLVLDQGKKSNAKS